MLKLISFKKIIKDNFTESPKREITVDILRGIVVFLMIIAHSIAFFHTKSSPILNYLMLVGDTVCFVTFLFLSGTSTYLGFLSKEVTSNSKVRYFRRIFSILIGYYILAILTYSKDIFPLTIISIKEIYEIILFINVPSYAEFLLPFIFYSLLIVFFHKIFKHITKKLALTLLIGIATYVLGTLLYTVNTPTFLLPVKAIFVGHSDWYRFPLMQYFAVLLIGMNWGYVLSSKKSQKIKEQLSLYIGVSFFLLMIIFAILNQISYEAFFGPLKRWPPSLTFLTIGLTFSFLSIASLYIVNKKSLIRSIWRSFIFFGKRAFDFFLFHLILLKLYDFFIGKRFDSILINFVSLTLLILATSVLVLINQYIYPWLKVNLKFEPDELIIEKIHKFLFRRKEDRRILKKRQFILAGFLFLTFIGTVGLFDEFSSAPSPPPPWYDQNYGYYSNLSIRNNGLLNTINSGTWSSFTFNHKELVESRKSLFSGNDLKLLYLTSAGYQEVPFRIFNPESEGTQMVFETQEDIWPRQEDLNYYLYYGNNFAQATFSDAPTDSYNDISVTFVKEVKSELLGNINKVWNLKEQTTTADRTNAHFTVELTKGFLPDNYKMTYELLDTKIKGEMVLEKKNQWSSLISISDLEPGQYQLQATATTDEFTIESNIVGFYVSYPLYITWSMDWEGYDVPNEYLDTMTNLSERHFNLPITHFFNPRIYIAYDVTQARQDYLTNWILNRRDNNGDEIGLHLHMHYDLLNAMGITTQLDEEQNSGEDQDTSTNGDGAEIENSDLDETSEETKQGPWGEYNNGYDVPTTDYSYEELLIMFEWSKNMFNQKGLGTPISYRAGGWFADAEVLTALQDSGFLLDSSGRESYYLGRLKGPWNLSSQTQPYKPNIEDSNSSSEPTLNIWEFPNNGGNSETYTGEQMLNNLKNNYSGGVLEDKKTVIFLSHPHWFDIKEEEKIEQVFRYTDMLANQADRGPVLYVTLEQSYQAWNK